MGFENSESWHTSMTTGDHRRACLQQYWFVVQSLLPQREFDRNRRLGFRFHTQAFTHFYISSIQTSLSLCFQLDDPHTAQSFALILPYTFTMTFILTLVAAISLISTATSRPSRVPTCIERFNPFDWRCDKDATTQSETETGTVSLASRDLSTTPSDSRTVQFADTVCEAYPFRPQS